jgi:pyruvate dehydrogenase E1 component alpha subunit
MEALKQAREHGESRLLEMVCYRQHDHTTADDASRYEMKNIREEEWKREPVIRLRQYLEKKGIWSEQKEEALQTECAADVDEAVKEYLAVAPQPLESMFDYLYAELPQIYVEQRDMLKDVEKVVHG